ncbi:resolvase [Elizabethkingia anophelis]|uniref:Resolvase n=3 Tax=Weeksellaceae TaxID=2762318 RepID=A0A494J9H2_9FLAO|nr:resolvase [Elizabethkingia anophelis]ATC34985.1 resolvase [Elizabethkingia anophelis R26]ATC38626.1 resolvase [Elizabethkingia anophelis Ag1]QQM26798.1 resolvase [Elizabethkingia sp. M8]ATC42306.1 resolvase [Elizabethkingia anophelis]
MRIFNQLFITSAFIVFVGCNSKNKTSETNKMKTEVTQKAVTFADFKKIKGVDNVQNVPFQLFTKLDSVQFYVSPDKNAARLKKANNKLDNYYGFEEFDDFYSIHFSIDNNISNSIEAFVLKSEFKAAFELTLKGVNLYEIRSSTFKESDDFKNKSFNKYGTIDEVPEQEFKTASKKRIDEALVKNPHITLKDNNWIYTENGKQEIITQHKDISTETGPLANEYIGRSSALNMEVFKENSNEVTDPYYSFFNIKNAVMFDLATSGYPQILPVKNWVSFVSSNNDVGSNFVISKYFPQTKKQDNLLYVNFTNFKIGDEKKAFWAENDTFYAEVYPLNSASAKGKKQKAAYIKIRLKSNLF